MLNDDENSPNDNSQTEYTSPASDAELVKSEAAASGGPGASSTSADPLSITSNAEEQLDRSAGSAAAASTVTPSVDAYAMQRYNNYDSNYAANYVQSYYGATAGSAGYPHMTGALSAPFLYPHLYSAGHHATSAAGHQHAESGIVEDYNNPEVAGQRTTADAQGVPASDQHAGQHTGYSQIGEDESQTGPIRGGYLKSEHGVWRPY